MKNSLGLIYYCFYLLVPLSFISQWFLAHLGLISASSPNRSSMKEFVFIKKEARGLLFNEIYFNFYFIINKYVFQMKNLIILLLVFILAAANYSFGQAQGLYVPRNMQRAFDNKTRSMDGKPGINYWQNKSEYIINLEIHPVTRKLEGTEKIEYVNNSPDTLKEMIIHLFPNIFKKGAARDFGINASDEDNGVTVANIKFNGTTVSLDPDEKLVEFNGTNMVLKLRTPILPKGKAELSISWNYTINKGSNLRTGTLDSSSFFIAYFYPHVAVYDDIDGWNDTQYTGGVEFYNDFADYDVSITVPKNFVIRGTGVLQNPEEVLNGKFVERYKSALGSDKIVSIVSAEDVAKKDVTFQNEKNVWKFKAENVTDFAFGLSDHYLWDGSGLVVDKNSGRRVFIDAAYNKNSKDFYKVAQTAREVIDYMSTVLPGWPYPFPKETVYNGQGGMEYPMMVNDSSVPDSSMRGLTAHEIAHSYFPFFMGTNETKYAWMDEGWAAYIDFMASSALYSTEIIKRNRISSYKNAIGDDIDIPIFAISKYLKSPPYRYNAYIKAACFYDMLREYLGHERFSKALHAYMERWNGKHPIPYDFFNSMSNASGEDLSWLIKPWFFEYGYMDLAVKNVSVSGDKYKIEIEKKGYYPGGFKIIVTYADGKEEIVSESVRAWKDGADSFTVELPASRKITKVELWDSIWLDANATNDTFILK